MKIKFYKYQGTGNDFVIIDNRNLNFPKDNHELIENLCDRKFGIGGDGLMLLENSDNYDFKMIYFNSDGKEGSMCGNGGRCLVAFAKKLNIFDQYTTFEAIDGLHKASISEGLVSLEMNSVSEIKKSNHSIFMNTGSPHHIEFVKNLDEFDIYTEGKKIRYGAPYFEEGTNVNFVESISENDYKVRTYERGVENETLSCGTGVTAVALSTNYLNKSKQNTINLFTPGGQLKVSFDKKDDGYENIKLIGPATFVFEGEIEK